MADEGLTISRGVTASSSAATGADADPIATEVVRYGLEAAADQMRLALKRTAFSPIIYEMTDFAAALYDRDVRLLAQARALPLFMGTLGFAVKAAIERVGGVDALEPGDIIFSTHGYDIGSHPQDATIVVPGFYDGELIGYAVVKAHHMDIGAKEPFCTDTTDIWQEGTIFPGVKLYKAGERQEDLYRTVVANTRLPDVLIGDLNAQIGAARVGLERLTRLIERTGPEKFWHSIERMLDHGEDFIRRFLGEVPDGRYLAQGTMDNNGIDDEPIPLSIAMEIEGDRVLIDLSETAPEQAGPINCPLAATVSAARVAIMTLAGGHSANEGHFRPIDVKTKPGTIFHPRSPAPIFLYGWSAMQMVDLVHRAFSSALPDAVPAGNCGDLCAVIWWGEKDDGTPWADGTDHFIGQGASSRGDSVNPLMHISCSGITVVPAEVIEARRPLVVERYEFVPDSGGAGTYRGGLGVEIHYRALRDIFITVPWEGTKTPPWGVHGGLPGMANRCRVRQPDGSVEAYVKTTGLPVPVGAVVEVRTGGGGGFGPPEQRDPESVRRDVEEGYVTEAAAQRDYPHAFAVTQIHSDPKGDSFD